MRSKQSTGSTRKSLGFVSERDIDQWGSDLKQKARLYERGGAQNLRPHSRAAALNNPEMTIDFNSSINQLRDRTRSERSNSSSLSNRMNYMAVDLRRKKQIAEIARTKYQKMIETRTRSFIEKSELKQERKDMARTRQMSVTLQASRIRDERKNISVMAHDCRKKNKEEAVMVKEERYRNEQLISSRRTLEVEKKRAMVESSHRSLDRSRLKMKELHDSKIQHGKAQHNWKLVQEFTRGQMQRKHNSGLRKVFQNKQKDFEVKSSQYAQEIEEYQKLLGMQYSQPPSKRGTSSSCYVTC